MYTTHDLLMLTLLHVCMYSDGEASFEAGVKRIPAGKQMMLLPYIQDALIPAKEMEKLAVLLGSNVCYSILFHSTYHHLAYTSS
jgi:hypothetical protein